MTFALAQTRYVSDEDGRMYDSLVEHAIDVICGESSFPLYLPFAVNRVMKEYLYSIDTVQPFEYRYVPIYYHEHLGVYFGADHHNYMDDVWYLCAPSLWMSIDAEGTHTASIGTSPDHNLPAMSGGPVPLISPDATDLTFTLACLLLCRQIAAHQLAQRFPKRNNHKGSQHGKDKAKV